MRERLAAIRPPSSRGTRALRPEGPWWPPRFPASGAGLVELLADDIVLWSDGGGKVRAARRPIAGRGAVARFLLGLARKWAGQGTVQPAEVNGQAGFLLEADGQRIGVLVLDIAGDLIRAVCIVVNPDKLTGIGLR